MKYIFSIAIVLSSIILVESCSNAQNLHRNNTTANAGFQFDTMVGGRKVTFTGNVNNLLNAKYWTQTNIGEGINAAMSVRLSW